MRSQIITIFIKLQDKSLKINDLINDKIKIRVLFINLLSFLLNKKHICNHVFNYLLVPGIFNRN